MTLRRLIPLRRLEVNFANCREGNQGFPAVGEERWSVDEWMARFAVSEADFSWFLGMEITEVC